LYFLGGGIARYLGYMVRWDLFWLGLLWLFPLQLSAHFLNDFFVVRPVLDEDPVYSSFSRGSGAIGPGKLSREVALWAALVMLTTTASFSVLLLRNLDFSAPLIIIMLILIFGVLVYTIPPIRLAASGYGGLLVSILVANMVPAFSYLIQVDEVHKYLAMTTFPLTAIHLAMVIIFSLPEFANDVKYENSTLLTRLGWREGMNLHNLLILSAYLLLGLAALFGFPPRIAIPAILTLPLGLLQIWQVTRISAGASPNWPSLRLSAMTLFLATTYLLSYAFWTR
jgi:1,4-dihydroxy-2-naphthoate octaprenyltransferase